MPSWSEIANIATSLGLAATAVGLLLVFFQIKSANRTTRAQFIHELEVDAQRFQYLYKHLLPVDRPITDELSAALAADEMGFYSALNFFEKVQLLVHNGSIDLESVDALYAGRFFLLVHSPIVQSTILTVPDNKPHFMALRELYNRWFNYRKERGMPILLEETKIVEFL